MGKNVNHNIIEIEEYKCCTIYNVFTGIQANIVQEFKWTHGITCTQLHGDVNIFL